MNTPFPTSSRLTMFLSASLMLLLTACADSHSYNSAPKANLTRLDLIIEEFPALGFERKEKIIDSIGSPFTDYLIMMGMPGDDFAAETDMFATSEAATMFGPQIKAHFTSTETLEANLGYIDAAAADLLPDMPQYSYYSVISPFRQQIMLVDSIAYIALNHYLGANHEAYNGMPDYIRRSKESDRIAVDMAEAIIATNYPYDYAEDMTVLSYLLYQGALVEGVSQLTGVDDIATLMCWSIEEAELAASYEADAWQRLAAANILYSNDPAIARNLVSPASSTSLLSAEIPGRMGRYIGYKIVKSWLALHPEADLSTILSSDFYHSRQTLIDASYSPQ